MSKIALFLFVFIIPFLGLSQGKRKTHKQLINEHALLLQVNDSVTKIQHSIVAKYNLHLNEWDQLKAVAQIKHDSCERLKSKIKNVYRNLVSIDETNEAEFSIQSINDIEIPYINTYRSNPLDTLHQLHWTMSLEGLSIKKQNGVIKETNRRINAWNTVIAFRNIKNLQYVLRLKSKNQELKEAYLELDVVDLILNAKLKLANEQLELAKKEFILKGPRGFNVHYFVHFPDVFPDDFRKLFPDYIPEPIQEEVDYSGTETYGFAIPINENIPVEVAKNDQEPEIFTYVDEPASFNGNLKQYLAANINYPKKAIELGLEGKCYLQFVVSSSGDISNIEVMRGVPDCPECDEEAIRVVKGMPKWNPGKNAGVAVHCNWRLPVSFKLSTE